MPYSVEQRVLIVQAFYESDSSIKATVRKLRDVLGRDNVPTKATIYRLVRKFEERGTVTDKPKPGPRMSAITAENIAAVRDSVAESPSTSIRHRSRELGISPTALWRILQLLPDEEGSQLEEKVRRLSSVPEDDVVVFVQFILSQLKALPKPVFNRLLQEIPKLVDGKGASFNVDVRADEVAVKNEMEAEEFKVDVKQEIPD